MTIITIPFSYDKHAISIRTGSLIDKEDFLFNDQTNYGDVLLAIEGKLKEISIEMEIEVTIFLEPFDFSNTARSVYDEMEFDRIVRVFRRSYYIIEKTKSFSSILEEPIE